MADFTQIFFNQWYWINIECNNEEGNCTQLQVLHIGADLHNFGDPPPGGSYCKGSTDDLNKQDGFRWCDNSSTLLDLYNDNNNNITITIV